MRYCVKCGKLEEPDKPLINGLCPDCFIKYRGVFKKTPVLNIVICSKCGMWRHSGKWQSYSSLEEIVARSLNAIYRKFVNDGIEYVEVNDVRGIHRATREYYEALVDLSILFKGGAYATTTSIVRFKVEKTVCPRCLRKSGKAFNALVQVRSERGFLTENEIDYVYDVIAEDGIADEVIEINENKNGIDIKILDPVVAKRIAAIISRDKGAKIIETFKLRKYDPSRGIKQGITTISIRLPDISEGDIVLYNGEPGIVKRFSGTRIIIEKLDGNEVKVSMEDYWRGIVSKPKDLVMENEYTVVGYDSSSIYLVDNVTGEFIEYPRSTSLYNLKQGDKMRGFRIGNRLYIVRSTDLKGG